MNAEIRARLEEIKKRYSLGSKDYDWLRGFIKREEIAREALGQIKKWSLDGQEKIRKVDTRHPLIGHLVEFELTACEALKKMSEVES